LVEGPPERWAPLSELLLHNAARHDHVQRTVAPALNAGTWVVCDRFADSTMAYQGYAQDVDLKTVAQINRWAAGDVWPDLTIVLDLPVEEGLARAQERRDAEDRYERMGSRFHERIRAAFLDIAKDNPERCVVVGAAAAPDQVAAQVWDSVQARLSI
jgi:dTMP kinase